jgi:hypothetical protein
VERKTQTEKRRQPTSDLGMAEPGSSQDPVLGFSIRALCPPPVVRGDRGVVLWKDPNLRHTERKPQPCSLPANVGKFCRQG